MDHLSTLCLTAASIGLTHTLLGPDHYVPFVAMARAGRWSSRRVLVITTLCGLAHVLSSVVIGAVGLGVGAAVLRLVHLESVRAMAAGWLMAGFGFAYTLWAVRRSWRRHTGIHVHARPDGSVHVHAHASVGTHEHEVDRAITAADVSRDGLAADGATMTPWVLFTIFVFGPCEPLIPLLMFPAATSSPWTVLMVTVTFGVVTIGTMLVMVAAMLAGMERLKFLSLVRFGEVLAGGAVTACGIAMIAGF